ncbi:MAG: DnaA/Hda family protein, partial [Planctomycetota bacterium]
MQGLHTVADTGVAAETSVKTRSATPAARKPVRRSITGPSVGNAATTADRDDADYLNAPDLDPQVWNRILTHIRLKEPSLNRTWFKQLRPRKLPHGVIHVTCQDLAQLNYLNDKCQATFSDAAQEVTKQLGMVVFHCEKLRAKGVFDPQTGGDQLKLSPDYTFEHFVTGPGNQIAHAAAVAVCDQLGRAYNPLFIHGGCGLGKTHLLQAICHKIQDTSPDLRICFLSCDQFINEYINSIEANDS